MTLPWGGKLALKPFFGVMGVAPPPNWGRITSIVPRAMGGNMDNKELVAGTKVYFPVFNEGAHSPSATATGRRVTAKFALPRLKRR